MPLPERGKERKREGRVEEENEFKLQNSEVKTWNSISSTQNESRAEAMAYAASR